MYRFPAHRHTRSSSSSSVIALTTSHGVNPVLAAISSANRGSSPIASYIFFALSDNPTGMDTSFLTLNSSGFGSGSNFLTDSCGRSTVLGGSFACSGRQLALAAQIFERLFHILRLYPVGISHGVFGYQVVNRQKRSCAVSYEPVRTGIGRVEHIARRSKHLTSLLDSAVRRYERAAFDSCLYDYVASQSPEIILFLMGNVRAEAGKPGGNSVIRAPL